MQLKITLVHKIVKRSPKLGHTVSYTLKQFI